MLNARYHEQEALIVADAGVPGAVTIATNMAGRGTDIQLGGNLDMQRRPVAPGAARPGRRGHARDGAGAARREIEAEIADLKQQALAAGGLFVLGTERHESRRIDNQLRGRTGRQGDPGHSKFFLSCEDDLLRIFAGERLDAIMRTFGVAGRRGDHPQVAELAPSPPPRSSVEQRNYEIRKNLLKYDDVVNDQRKAVFEQRQEFMDADRPLRDRRRDAPRHHRRPGQPPPAAQGLCRAVGHRGPGRAGPATAWAWTCRSSDWAAEEGIANEEIEERIAEAADARAAEREALIGAEHMRGLEKNFLLQMIDLQWREHLMHLDHLRNVIGLRGYGQRDPLNEYKTEAFSLFEKLLVDLRQNVTRWLMTVEFQFEAAAAAAARPVPGGPPRSR